MGMEVRHYYLALICLQALHSTEEVLFGFNARLSEITAKIHEIIPVYPVISLSRSSFVLVNIALAVVLVALVPAVSRGGKWIRRFVIMVAVVEFFNGLAHLSMAVIVRGYFPGAPRAIGLLIVDVILFRSAVCVPKTANA